MPSTKDVLNHHLKALKQGDVNAVLSDYAPGAVLCTKDGPRRGPTQSGRCSKQLSPSLRSRSNIQNEAAVGRRRSCLCFVDGRDCRKPDSELVESDLSIGGPNGNRTRVPDVGGRCPNR